MEGEFTKVATSPQVAKYMGFAKTAARRDMASRNAANGLSKDFSDGPQSEPLVIVMESAICRAVGAGTSPIAVTSIPSFITE